MKHTRKKVLLASVAMLLVALVALGSATYAWFTIQRTVTADTMKVTAVAQKGIEISIDNEANYSTTTQHFTDGSYEALPVSWASDMSKTGFIPEGEVTNASTGAYTGTFKSAGSVPTPATTGEAVSATAASTYFRAYRVYVRSTANTGGARTAYDLTATVTVGGTAANYARVALYDQSTSTIVATFANAAATGTAPIAAAAGTAGSVDLKASGATIAKTDLTGTDTTAVGKAYQLIVWFEGTDADCIDANADKTAEVSISFTAVDK